MGKLGIAYINSRCSPTLSNRVIWHFTCSSPYHQHAGGIHKSTNQFWILATAGRILQSLAWTTGWHQRWRLIQCWRTSHDRRTISPGSRHVWPHAEYFIWTGSCTDNRTYKTSKRTRTGVHPDPTGATNECLAGSFRNVAATTGRRIYSSAEYFVCTARLIGINHDGTANRTTTAIHLGPADATDDQLAGSTGSIIGTTGPPRTSGNCCASVKRGSTDSANFKLTTTVFDSNASTFDGCAFICCSSAIDMARGSSSISSDGALGNPRPGTANSVQRTTSIKPSQCNVQRRPTDRVSGSSGILQSFYSHFIRGVLDVKTLCRGFPRHATSCDAVSVDIV